MLLWNGAMCISVCESEWEWRDKEGFNHTSYKARETERKAVCHYLNSFIANYCFPFVVSRRNQCVSKNGRLTTARNYFYAVILIKILHHVLNKVSLEPNIVKRHEISEILIWEPNVSLLVYVFLYWHLCIFILVNYHSLLNDNSLNCCTL